MRKIRPALPDFRDEFESTSIIVIPGNVIVTFNTFKTRKGVPELRGLALVCLSAMDKNHCIVLPHGPESYMFRI